MKYTTKNEQLSTVKLITILDCLQVILFLFRVGET